MKIPLSWLSEYIESSLSPTGIAKTLTMLGIEVEDVRKLAPGLTNVVVATVLETERHPNADKLVVAKVSDGSQTYQVVCGAANCRPNLKTAFAREGAQLFDEKGQLFTIKKTKLRGVESQGMLCAPEELGLDDDQEGIIEFAEHVKVGMNVSDLYSDTIFDLSLTPNLGHCMSIIGVARELSAASGQPFKTPSTNWDSSSAKEGSGPLTLKVQDPVNCPRYACRVFEHVKVGPSPEWLKERLTRCGLRSVNNVVDLTNYVFLELGHPLHAFDLDRISGGEIIVRDAQAGEKITTLDGKERTLAPGMLLIADRNSPLAIAGVMGGRDSEVGESTRRIAVESAYFNPRSIRKTSKSLGLITDAARRFEKGADPNIILQALDRFTLLLQQITACTPYRTPLEFHAQPFPEKILSCRYSKINQLLGTVLSHGEVENIFQRLGFKADAGALDEYKVTIPTFRNDITQEIDLIEEIARIYGYDNIPRSISKHYSSQLPNAPLYELEKKCRQLLMGEGLQEFLTCDLIGPSLLKTVHGEVPTSETQVKIINPTSIEQSILRESLLPGLLEVVKHNIDHQNSDLSGFEVGRVHFKSKDHYVEQVVAGIVLSGRATPHQIDPKPREVDFYDLKGIIENFLSGLSIQNYVFKPTHLHTFHPGRQAGIFVNQEEIGSMGEIHPAIQRRLDVPQRILFAELNLQNLMPLRAVERRMRSMIRFPGITRDWTLTIQESVNVVEVLDLIKKIPAPLLEKVFVWDIYRDDKLGPERKNVTFRFIYRDPEKTIAQEVADAEHARLIEGASKAFESLHIL